MLLIYLLFPAIVVAIDYLAYKSTQANGGTLQNFWLGAIGIGILILGLPFLTTPVIIHHPQQTITTSSGNTIIPAYNSSYTQSKSTQNYSLVLGEIIVFVQFAYSLLMLLYAFTIKRRKRYED